MGRCQLGLHYGSTSLRERNNDGILIVVDRATKMVHLVPIQQTITAAETARVY